jgi:pyruvate dehydrogenase E2 component (dihydrolipoamide acetyltransferase)
MRYFKLPDLGEGLQEAEIVEWHVREGDEVSVDQVLVSVETAKAVVEVPSPQDGVLCKLFGEPGDILHIGEPLVEFETGEDEAATVVGTLSTAEDAGVQEDQFIIGAPPGDTRRQATQNVSTAAKRLAEELGVDLKSVPVRGDRRVRPQDVERAHKLDQSHGPAEPLRRVRRSMAKNMSRAHAQVVHVSIFEDADVHAWPADADATIRLVLGIAYACTTEPTLNVWFDGELLTRRSPTHIDLGIAVNTEDGLFVPVLRNIAGRSPEDLRSGLDRLRADVQKRTIPPKEMQGATITLSNFGMLGGRYATPVVVPPTVAIIGAGRRREEVVAFEGEVAVHPVLPLSVTFDHRVVTGAEAARFISALKAALENPE